MLWATLSLVVPKARRKKPLIGRGRGHIFWFLRCFLWKRYVRDWSIQSWIPL